MSSSDPDPDRLAVVGRDAAFSPDLDDKYRCPVCLDALQDPLQTVCGHRFCKLCLTRSTGNRRSLFGRCPLDKTFFTSSQVFEDNAARREVLSLTIKCDNYKDGCVWKGELRNRESHATECPEAKVSCSNNCGHVCSKRLLQTHIVMCPLRKEPCSKCGLSLLASGLTKHHLLVCGKFLLTCTLCGEVELAREDMARHIDVTSGDCPMAIVTCPFAKIGCYFQAKRKNMQLHKTSSLVHHHDLILIGMRQLDQQMINTRHHRPITLSLNGQYSFIREQSQTLRVIWACVGELQHDCEGRLLWNIVLPADRSTPLTSPTILMRRCCSKNVKIILDLLSPLVNNGTPSLSVSIDGKLETGCQPFEGLCRLLLFSKSPLVEDYAVEFAFVLSSEERVSSVGRQGLFGFMPTDYLYTGPYAEDGRVTAFVQIRAKGQ